MWVKLTEHLVVDPTAVVGIQDNMHVDVPGVRNTAITLKSGAILVTNELTASAVLDKLSINWVQRAEA